MMTLFTVLNIFVLTHGLRLPVEAEEKEKLKAVIFHADDRPVNPKGPSQVTIDEMSFVELASMVDLAYAEKHGYEFRHYVLPPKGVSHPVFGKRHVAWAKFLALRHAGNEFPNADFLMMHDSDTAVVGNPNKPDHNNSLSEFMDLLMPGEYDPTHWKTNDFEDLFQTCRSVQDAHAASQLKHNSPIWLNQGCKGHFVLMKPSEEAWKILAKAWNYPKNQNNFPWEQQAWNYLAAKQTKGLMMIAGMHGSREDWEKNCKGADLQIHGFNDHVCHFQDDNFLSNTYGDRSARDHLREDLGCGPEWENKCVDNARYEDAITHHNLYKGNRKLFFLDLLRRLGHDDQRIKRLYSEMRARVVELTPDSVETAMDQLYEPPDLHPEMARNDEQQQTQAGFTAMVHDLISSKVDHPMEKGSRERRCWCDGP